MMNNPCRILLPLLLFPAILAITFGLFGMLIRYLQRKRKRYQQDRNNNPSISSTEFSKPKPQQQSATVNEDDNATASIHQQRVKVFKTLLPKQQRLILKGRMTYDLEDQVFRYTCKKTRRHEFGGGINKSPPSSAWSHCGFCLEKLAKGEHLLMGLCQHVYHQKCCMDWMVKQNTCPLCRQEMADEVAYKTMIDDYAAKCKDNERSCCGCEPSRICTSAKVTELTLNMQNKYLHFILSSIVTKSHKKIVDDIECAQDL